MTKINIRGREFTTMKCRILFFLIFALILSGCSSMNAKKDPAEVYKNYTAEQLYDSGGRAISQGEYAAAIRYFEALDSLYPFSPFAEKGDLGLMYAYYQTDDYASTSATAQRFIRLYPRNEHVDYAYYMKGLSALNQGKPSVVQRYFPVNSAGRDLVDMRQAFFDFRDLIGLYPHSKYAPDARQRMIYIRNLLAEYEIQVGNYYLMREAYVAAANRATYVIHHYPYTPQVREALVILVAANRGMGLTEAANEAERILKANSENFAQTDPVVVKKKGRILAPLFPS